MPPNELLVPSSVLIMSSEVLVAMAMATKCYYSGIRVGAIRQQMELAYVRRLHAPSPPLGSS